MENTIAVGDGEEEQRDDDTRTIDPTDRSDTKNWGEGRRKGTSDALLPHQNDERSDDDLNWWDVDSDENEDDDGGEYSRQTAHKTEEEEEEEDDDDDEDIIVGLKKPVDEARYDWIADNEDDEEEDEEEEEEEDEEEEEEEDEEEEEEEEDGDDDVVSDEENSVRPCRTSSQETDSQQKGMSLTFDSNKACETVAEIWACEHCTYENPIQATICEMCSRTTGKNNPDFKESMSKTSGGVLPCALDELANIFLEENGCNETETAIESFLDEACREAESVTRQFWTCQICTFINDSKSPVCEMCLEAKTTFDELFQLEEDTVTDELIKNLEIAGDGETANEGFAFGTEALTEESIDQDGGHASESIRDGDIEAAIQSLMEDEVIENYDRAKMAVHLMRLGFKEHHCIVAATNCDTVDGAVSFLQRKCELCCGEFPASEMVAMLYCTDSCCNQCAISYFSLQVKEKNITDAVCPICGEPNLKDGDIRIAYFSQLGSVLKGLLDDDTYNLFQRKLRDFALAQDMEFHWCQNCEFGLCIDGRVRRFECPECKHAFCIKCKEKWMEQHERLTCEDFLDWKRKNSIEHRESALQNYLKKNGLQCPNCKTKYDIAKGGCIHYKCPQCKHEFCGGCRTAFLGADNCNRSEVCKTLGLHAHHPRNCFFYTRDKDPKDLLKILQTNGVDYATKNPSNLSDSGCPVMEQKECPEGYKDAVCGLTVDETSDGLCRVHYVEYLCTLVKQHNLDTVSLMDIPELQQELRRNGKAVPTQEDQETDQTYQDRLTKAVQSSIPLAN